MMSILYSYKISVFNKYIACKPLKPPDLNSDLAVKKFKTLCFSIFLDCLEHENFPLGLQTKEAKNINAMDFC